MGEKAVEVLLSTFNGARYLHALLTSVLEQEYGGLRFLIRDDGSTDGTSELLAAYESLPGVRVIYGENIGVIRSFFTLLQEVDNNVAYVALCDQDDVWKADKISRAVATLEPLTGLNKPALYCSDQMLVDDNLRPLRSYGRVLPRPSFENALVQNIAPGCTMVFNKQAHVHVAKEFPRRVRMHDWWIYQVVSGVGEVVYDDYPTILYRQQVGNVVGSAATPFGRWFRRLRRFAEGQDKHLITEQAGELLRIHGASLDNRKSEILARFLSGRDTLAARIHYAVTTELRRQTFPENAALRLLIVLNRV
jgi:glycosyltransferase involved in cell wall biosynthesis